MYLLRMSFHYSAPVLLFVVAGTQQHKNRQRFYRFSLDVPLTAPAIKCDVRRAIFRNFWNLFEAAIEIPSGGYGTSVKVWIFFFKLKFFSFEVEQRRVQRFDWREMGYTGV